MLYWTTEAAVFRGISTIFKVGYEFKMIICFISYVHSRQSAIRAWHIDIKIIASTKTSYYLSSTH